MEKFKKCPIVNNCGGHIKAGGFKQRFTNFDLWLFCLPGVIITLIYHYFPIYGIQLAFKDYSIRAGITGSEWVGMDNFVRFFTSPNAWEIILNTLILSIYSLVAGFPVPIILALMLNSFRHKKYRKVIQTITYAPHFISVVVMCGMLILFLSPSMGFINSIVEMLGFESVNFLAKPGLWRHLYVWSGVWQGMGWGSVIYFAALSGVSPEYHEAARIDGASKFQCVMHIDLPTIMPTIVMMLILSCGSLFSIGFEKAFALQNPLNLEVSEIISTYVYKVGLVDRDVSFSSAIGLLNSAVNSILLISVNWISRKVSENSLW